MRRRDFIVSLGSAVVAGTGSARSQPASRVRLVGVLMGLSRKDAEAQALVGSFVAALSSLGWSEGHNVQFAVRWGGTGDEEHERALAKELTDLNPDVILASGIAAVAALQRETRSIPIVFVLVSEPMAQGFVSNLARPGGNTTGFANFEYSIGSKWLQTLKEAAPAVTRVVVMGNPETSALNGYVHSMTSIAGSLGVEVIATPLREPEDIAQALSKIGDEGGGGIVAIPDAFNFRHRAKILALAAQYRLPAMYPYRYLVADGGLLSYGPDRIEQFRNAAGYAHRILNGEKSGDLPVQQPTKFELVINLKTAKALGLDISSNLLARVDEVIE
ncbi:MAG TPA: ABC transporter substrate-binding protein [Stellaceae bacterium]|nr:ABC transporter substrate-binding protein [Stellaceae bacterium]